MWRALQKLDLPRLAERGLDFVELEVKALRQWEAIEERRCGLAPKTFSALTE
jgi:hypothetical protein